MFPRLTQRLSTALLDRLDLVIEVSTLGEYGLAEDGLPIAGEPRTSRPRGDCSVRSAPAAIRPARDSCPR